MNMSGEIKKKVDMPKSIKKRNVSSVNKIDGSYAKKFEGDLVDFKGYVYDCTDRRQGPDIHVKTTQEFL